MRLDDIFNDPANAQLLAVENSENYKGYTVYSQDGTTIATKLNDTGLDLLTVKGTSNAHRVAMKLEIDDREAK